jgi:MurNAc alpha-1-phosphate uridylyltransferase
MRAMILAAGRGERMRPLTDHMPKPLLPVGGKPLIVWHLERLAAAGFREVVINTAHLGEQIPAALGDGSAWGLRITYSPEPPGALETAGGIARALPHLGNAPFLVMNGDIFCDWNPGGAFSTPILEEGAHLVLVDNPPHHPAGDFRLAQGRLGNPESPDPPGISLTFAGIGIYTPAFFRALSPNHPAKLAPLLRAAADKGLLTGEHHTGHWTDIGTPERLRMARGDQESGIRNQESGDRGQLSVIRKTHG